MNSSCDTLDQVYLDVLNNLLVEPQFKCQPRGMAINEILDYNFEVKIPSSQPIKTLDPVRNGEIAEYTNKEFALYESGTCQVADFKNASKFWGKLANPDGTVNSAYGFLIFHNKSVGSSKFGSELQTPWEWAKSRLISDPDTRQAVLPFCLPEHLWDGNKDVTCTVNAQFFIRENKLHLSVNMRSQDAWFGLTYDAPWFVRLMEKMVAELSETYRGISVGSYRHHAASMHLYQRNFASAAKAAGLNDYWTAKILGNETI